MNVPRTICFYRVPGLYVALIVCCTAVCLVVAIAARVELHHAHTLSPRAYICKLLMRTVQRVHKSTPALLSRLCVLPAMR